jgi:DNA invertase Pin-like site-specific DNA recombinase
MILRKSLAVVLSGGKTMRELSSYNVGVYCRLSKQDKKDRHDSNRRREESVSIQTQRDILGKYVNDRKDKGWRVYDYYIDDDHTGTNFKRPGFERLIEDIENGAVNMIVVKDLSRLGRSHIETDTYMEIYFPERDVRVIAVDENTDSMKMEENNNDIVVPIKNMLNELYSRDLSRKVRSALRTMKQNGEYVGSIVAMGYQRDPKDKRKLIVEETGAAIVRRIFEMARADMGSKKICKALNDEGVPTPLNYRRWLLHGIEPNSARWHFESVNFILRNRVYLGDTAQGVYDVARFHRTPTKRKPKEEWIIVPRTHEPLVDVETWELVQKLIDARNRPTKSKVIQLFAGFVKCEDCGYALGYAYSQNIEQYTCGQYRRHGKNFCSCHYIRKDVLESVVLDDIRKYSKLAKNDADRLAQQLYEQNGDKDARHVKSLTSELENLITRNSELDRILKRLYEDNINGKISDDIFNKFLVDYEKEQSDVQTKISSTDQQIKDLKDNQRDTASWIELIKNYTKIKKLDRTVLGELVDKITVGEAREVDGHKVTDVTIYYRFVGAVS